MAKTQFSDDHVNFDAKGDAGFSLLTGKAAAMLQALSTLNSVIPMESYDVDRTGSSNTWKITAKAKDGRNYETTVSFTNGNAVYSLTSLPSGTLLEVKSFLEVIDTLSVYFLPNQIEKITIRWS